MLKINSLLNPASEHERYGISSSATPPTTPADTVYGFPASSPSSRPATPTTTTPKRQKRTKDANKFVPSSIRGTVNYPPFECSEPSVCLSSSQQRELHMQHELFNIDPTCQDERAGPISKNVQHIPYQSEKRGFLDKTGKGGFDVFRYSFAATIEDKGEKKVKTWPVMWDYQNGMVRITPFFKACNYSKTTPSKALNANPGLKDMGINVTGGAVEAQGYWIPYACARAVCLTFCYPIRWVLSPIFGPSFIKECLPPQHAGFGRFKIDAEVVRNSQLEMEGWRTGVPSRAVTPAYQETGREIPRSVPQHDNVIAQPPPQTDRPQFKHGSPFATDSESSYDRNYVYSSPVYESPALSPKSKQHSILTSSSPAWTSINRYGYDNSPSIEPTTPLTSLSGSLLTKPQPSPNTSWRAAEPVQQHMVPDAGPSTRLSTHRSQARPINDSAGHNWASARYSDDDHEYHPEVTQKKRKTSDSSNGRPSHKKNKISKSSSGKRKSSTDDTGKKGPSPSKWTEEDMQAARWLLRIHDEPRNFTKPKGKSRRD